MKPISVSKSNGLITLQIPAVLKSARQEYTFNQMLANNDVNSAILYLQSINGQRTRGLCIDRIKSGTTDKLNQKSTGSIRRLFDRMLSTEDNHKPMAKYSDYFGVEIECFIPRESLSACTDKECSSCDGSGTFYNEDSEESEDCGPCDGTGVREGSVSTYDALSLIFKDSRVKFSNIKQDGSIRIPNSSYVAVEFTVLTRFSDTSNLKTVCTILNKLGAQVNKSCGLHIHLDSRHLSSSQVLMKGKTFQKALPVLLSMQPDSRRSNHFCQPTVSKLEGGRYHAINLTAWSKYRTIEVRMHSSTTDFNKIVNWATLLKAIYNSEIKKSCLTLNDLTEYVSIEENLVEYIGQRISLFSTSNDTVPAGFHDNDTNNEEAA
jgi:hypothetical protein